MPIPTDDERIGSIVADKYRIDELLGRGGMGSVFRATHTWTERGVAVKFLHAEDARDPRTVRRFLREARAAAALRHPNAVDVLDMGEDPEAGVYMVLELLEGWTLAHALQMRGRLGFAETLKIMLPVMDALAAAHARGIIHRDLKPENIFLSKQSGTFVPKLLDFGIAKVQKRDNSSVTEAGLIMGTPAYMSPEQVQGRADLGVASDIWSLGVVLYECLTWRQPFESSSTGTLLVKILSEPPCPIERHVPSLAGEVSEIFQKAMAREPRERYRSVAELGQALRSVADRSSVERAARAPASVVEQRAITVVADPPVATDPATERGPAPERNEKTSSAAWSINVGPRASGVPLSMAARRGAIVAVTAIAAAVVLWLAFGRGDREVEHVARPAALSDARPSPAADSLADAFADAAVLDAADP